MVSKEEVLVKVAMYLKENNKELGDSLGRYKRGEITLQKLKLNSEEAVKKWLNTEGIKYKEVKQLLLKRLQKLEVRNI